MKDLEAEMSKQRNNRSAHKSQSHFLRNFPSTSMSAVIKPVTHTINHLSPLISLLGGHTGHIVNAVSGIVDKLV
jgi:hypothetical protein